MRIDFKAIFACCSYSFGVIHHTPEIAKAVSEIHRVLKPAGKAHVMIYHSRSLVAFLHELLRLPYEDPKVKCPVVYRHTRAETERLFEPFAKTQIHTDYPFTHGLRMVSALTPLALEKLLGRWIGWHLMIEATKADTAG